MENMATVLESLVEPNALSPLSTAVHDEEDFASLGHHHPEDSIVESHIGSDGDDSLVPTTGEDSHGHIVPPSITEDGDDNDHIGLSVAGIEPEPLHHEVEGLGAVVSETSDNVTAVSLEETDEQASLTQHGLLTQTHLSEDGGIADNVLLTADAEGNFAMRVSTDQVIRFLLQTSDGNVVAADAQVEAVKLSMPGLVPSGDVTQTFQSYTLPDGTTFFQTQKDNSSECQPTIVKEEAGTIKLEDGTSALLNPRETFSVPEGTIQAIQLEDGTTALITPQKDGFYDATPVTLEQFNTQTLMSVATEKPEKSLIIGEKAYIGDKAYKCVYEDCGRLYTTLHHLRVHERSHTGDRPFICEYSGCGKAFATGYGLKSHNRVHTGEKPYPCSEAGCEKAFKTSGDLQKHVRTHTGERPFKCPFEGCTRSFTTSNIRKVHIRTHTGERPYICDVEGCARAFASATNYKNHIRIHTGEKPYVCSVRGCGKAFTEYSSLYKHHVVHTHTKPYTCCYCGKTYRQTSTLAMHKRSSHGEDLPSEGGTTDNDKTEPPVKKKLKLEVKAKPDTGNQITVSASQGGASQQQVVLLTAPQVAQVTPTSSTSNNTIITTTEHNTTSTTTPIQDNQQLASLVTLQSPNGTLSLADLQQSGLHALNLGEGHHQVLVVTDQAQLELLQQLTSQQLESAVNQVSEGGVSTSQAVEQTSTESTAGTALLLQ